MPIEMINLSASDDNLIITRLMNHVGEYQAFRPSVTLKFAPGLAHSQSITLMHQSS